MLKHPREKICKSTLYKVFTEHVIFIRLFIGSTLFDIPNKDVLIDRLMINQEDIGNEIKSIVGTADADLLTGLLKTHIELATKCILDVKNKKPYEILDDDAQELYKNGDEISYLISSWNVVLLPHKKVSEEFLKHNRSIIDIALLLKQGLYVEEVQLYDRYYNHMLMFVDMLYSGLRNRHSD